ncbi:hypothetical protein IAU60_004977 [Kwoniella sp. DSM 27419]
MDRLPPATPATKGFGLASSVPSSVGTGENKGKEKKDDGGIPFLSNTICVLCHEGVLSGAEKGLIHYMTSCGHVICDSPVHDNKAGLCTACQKPMQAFPIQKGKLPEDLLRWFASPEIELHALEKELIALEKRLKSATQVMKFQAGHLNRSRELYRRTVEQQKVELAQKNDIITKQTAEVERLRQELEQALSEGQQRHDQRAREASMVNVRSVPFPTPRTPSIRPLPTVQEAQEEAAEHHSNKRVRSNEDAKTGDLSLLLSKKQRTDFLDQQPARFVPQGSFRPMLHPSEADRGDLIPPRARSVAGYGTSFGTPQRTSSRMDLT